jgi:hypothetical protein
LSTTETGTRTVFVLVPNVGPWRPEITGGKEEDVPEDEAPEPGLGVGVGRGFGSTVPAGAARRMATTKVSEAPASRSLSSRLSSSG